MLTSALSTSVETARSIPLFSKPKFILSVLAIKFMLSVFAVIWNFSLAVLLASNVCNIDLAFEVSVAFWYVYSNVVPSFACLYVIVSNLELKFVLSSSSSLASESLPFACC